MKMNKPLLIVNVILFLTIFIALSDIYPEFDFSYSIESIKLNKFYILICLVLIVVSYFLAGRCKPKVENTQDLSVLDMQQYEDYSGDQGFQ